MQHSESLANLAPALVAFEREVENPRNTAVNPFLKNRYAPLNDMLNEVRPLLAKHKLAVTQLPTGQGQAGVTTVLMHESGEYIADSITMQPESEKGKSDAQVAGSIITYLRRYALAAVLGIASEDDTDGNHNGHRQSEPPKRERPTPPPDAAALRGRDPGTMDKRELAAAINDVVAGLPDEEEYRSDARAAWKMEDVDRLRTILDRARSAKAELLS